MIFSFPVVWPIRFDLARGLLSKQTPTIPIMLNEQQTALSKKAVELYLQIKEWKAAIASNPTGYFEEIMTAELPVLEEQRRIANNELDAAMQGMQFNTFSDTWEKL